MHSPSAIRIDFRALRFSNALARAIMHAKLHVPRQDQAQKPPPPTPIWFQVMNDLHLRQQPDPRAPDVLAPPDDKMPKGSQVTIIDSCQVWMGSGRGEEDADNVWCPVIYGSNRGWANAYHLATDDGRRLACVIYPAARGCPAPQQREPSNFETQAPIP